MAEPAGDPCAGHVAGEKDYGHHSIPLERFGRAIACAPASGRKILLLDEPTSGLDYAHMMETAAAFGAAFF